jgi:hypothetical protein
MMAADNFLAFTSASIFVQYSFYTLNVVRDWKLYYLKWLLQISAWKSVSKKQENPIRHVFPLI